MGISKASANAVTPATKGALAVGSGTNTASILSVGSNGDTLVADSSTTTGLRYNPPVGSLGNPVINGGMDIWQRGTSFTSFGTTSSFTADRFYAYRGDLSSTFTVSRQSSGLTGIQYSTRIQRNSGNTSTLAINFLQDIESVNSIPFAGKTITFSFYARAGANYSAASSNLGFAMLSGTGTDQRIATGYTGSTTLFNTTATLTTNWQRFAATATVGTTATQLGLYFEFIPVGTAGANDWYEVTGVQIDVGTWTASTAPTFRRAGGSIQGELAACQRYYWRETSPINMVSYQANSQSMGNAFPVTMRTDPTMSTTMTNANYGTVWQFVQKTRTVCTKTGTATPTFSMSRSGYSLTFDGATFSPAPTSMETIAANNIEASAEL